MNQAERIKANRYLQQIHKLDECQQMLSQVMTFLLDETAIAPHKQTAQKPKLYLVKGK